MGLGMEGSGPYAPLRGEGLTKHFGRRAALSREMTSMATQKQPDPGSAYVDLYWIPLGAGGWFVRRNGRVFEALVALKERRPRKDLYHSALEVTVPEGRFTIEQTPVPSLDDARGVVAGGAVGARWAGRFRIFRYEVRCWRDGHIPDVAEAVDSPRRLTTDAATAQRLLQLTAKVPTPTWGRDELAAGEMWNSNSIISWLLATAGADADHIELPVGGRAPGWRAGLVVARRHAAHVFVT
jgi:hypothetical protein